MSTIHYLDKPFKKALNLDKVTDQLIEILYDFLPAFFSFWSLKVAQSRFNERQSETHPNWLDKLQVYVGLPDWVITEEQMLSEEVNHIKCPFGLLQSITDSTESGINCAIPFSKTDSLTGERYTVLFHTNTFDLEYHAQCLDTDIEDCTYDFENMPSQYERLVLGGHKHVREKTDYLVQRLIRSKIYRENMNVLKTSIASCRQLANGEKELLKAFLDVKNIDEKSIHEARRIYSNLDIEEFYEWASDHFGLDTYYEDSEDLVDHLKGIFRIDNDLLDSNEDYKFVTKMIGRSEPSYLNLQF